jgi:hypothetical protein
MSLNHYTADVIVTDAIMHEVDSTKIATFEAAVLAETEEDAADLIRSFYATSGLACKTVNGVMTIFRQAVSNLPGSIRSVKVENLVPVVEKAAEVIAPVVAAVETAAATTSKAVKAAGKKAAKVAAAAAEKVAEEAAPTEESKPEETGEIKVDAPATDATETGSAIETTGPESAENADASETK